MTILQLPHVSAPGGHPQGVVYTKAIQAQNADLGVASPKLGLLKY